MNTNELQDLAGIRIVFEDDILVVVSKPQGMAVHPAPGVRERTLVEWLRGYYASAGYPGRHVAAVSRLDRGTSGLVLLATDPAAHPRLHHQVVRRQIRRGYCCLVHGRPLFDETLVDVPIGRHWQDPRRMAVYDLSVRQAERRGARPARTRFRVVRRFPGIALLSAALETGRMHQIRVHARFIRHPVVGDPVYGAGSGLPTLSNSYPPSLHERIAELQWQCLHAGSLYFHHPLTGDPLSFEAPVPDPFASILAELETLDPVYPIPEDKEPQP